MKMTDLSLCMQSCSVWAHGVPKCMCTYIICMYVTVSIEIVTYFVSVYVRACFSQPLCTYVHTYIHVCTYVYIYTYVHPCVDIHTYVHTCVYIRTYVHVCTYCTYIRTYVHTCVCKPTLWCFVFDWISKFFRGSYHLPPLYTCVCVCVGCPFTAIICTSIVI